MGKDDKEWQAAAAAEEAAKAAHNRKDAKEYNTRKVEKSKTKGDRVSRSSPKAEGSRTSTPSRKRKTRER